MSTMSHFAHMLAAKADSQTIRRAVDAANRVGMNKSDLIRIGVLRVIEEIETTGRISIQTKPTIRITSATPTGRKLKTGKMKGGRK